MVIIYIHRMVTSGKIPVQCISPPPPPNILLDPLTQIVVKLGYLDRNYHYHQYYHYFGSISIVSVT